MMMSCTCRTAALRLFVRNVTSIQVPADFEAARHAARNRSLPTMTTPTSLLASQRTTGAFRSLQQSRSLHMTATRQSAEDAAFPSIPFPSIEPNGDGGIKPKKKEISEARKNRKTRRKEEQRQKKIEKQKKKKAKVKKKEKKARKAAAKADQTNTKPEKKEAVEGTPETPETPETPTEAVGSKNKEQREKKTSSKGWWKDENQAGKAKRDEGNTVDEEPRKKEKKVKPWEEERKKKLEARRKTEEEERLKNREPWQIQKEALKEKFPEGWKPMKKMSPDAMAGIRALHRQFPDTYTTEVLAHKFEMSPEAIRRILKSKWEEKDETPDIDIKRQERWFNRGKAVWTRYAAMGKKPPRKWREEGIVRDPKWNLPRGPPRNSRERKKFASVYALRGRSASNPGRSDDPEAAAANREWLSKRQHRRNLMAKDRKLLREASDNLLKSFF